MSQPILQQGSSGEPVKELQRLLNQLNHDAGHVDGIFGSHTTEAVKKFQRHHSLTVDGIVGAKTWQALYDQTSHGSSSSQPLLRKGSKGDAVRKLQAALRASGDYRGQIDGDFGSSTEAAVKTFQDRADLVVDGIVGERTWQKVNQIAA